MLLSTVIIGLIGASVGYYQFSKQVPGLENTPADFVLTANELFDAFDQNETSAMKRYEGKVIAVIGKVSRINSTDSTSNITLAAENAMVGGINCSFNEPVLDVDNGDSLTVKGRCQGFLMDVVLNNCTQK